MEKVGRLKARRECMVEVVRQAREAKENPLLEKHKKHPPMMAIYLYIGEWVFDWLVEWMKRNPHFCYEAGTPGVEFGNMRGGLRHRSGRVDEADMMLDSDLFLHYFPMGGEEEPGLAPRAHSFPALPTAPSTSSNPQRAPTAFIASAALPASSSLYSSMPVPSAPEISEKDLAGVSSSPPVSQPHPAPSAPPAEQMAPSSGSRLPIAGTAIHSRVSVQSRYELNEPPPYTPVADDGPVSRLSAEPQ
ncbi:hypothetical protein GQ54DRAFT_297085 [Martensiomyces pterosporus]|nr:hypothetical protein GQ54DRAFT_297085 [Martensiomyces pterosporus]